jgi:ACT domain-containing protein
MKRATKTKLKVKTVTFLCKFLGWKVGKAANKVGISRATYYRHRQHSP